MIHAYAATEAQGPLESFEFDPGPLGRDEVEIDVDYCGVCHSDLSMLNNDWHMTTYPFVPGHEVIGRVAAIGDDVATVKVGQRVGLGWTARSCMHCQQCMSGDHNLCLSAQPTIVGRHGGFADKVRAAAPWVFPLPDGLDLKSAGPLFCGGITVFNPLLQFDVKPTDRVGIIGIGGLGHMVVKFLDAWGCHVTAFSTSPTKEGESREMGADAFVATRDPQALKQIAGTLDLIISTVNVPLDWDAYIAALKPKGRLHIVGAIESLQFTFPPMIFGQKQVSSNPTGAPVPITKMLEFAARHHVEPIIEMFPVAKINDAMEKLRSGSPRYRLVLDMAAA